MKRAFHLPSVVHHNWGRRYPSVRDRGARGVPGTAVEQWRRGGGGGQLFVCDFQRARVLGSAVVAGWQGSREAGEVGEEERRGRCVSDDVSAKAEGRGSQLLGLGVDVPRRGALLLSAD